jgi:hypothetical protein
MAEAQRPAGLKKAGKQLWRTITAAYDLRGDEAALLTSACKTADEIDALEDALREAAPTVPSYPSGSLKANPLLNQLRLLRLAQQKLLEGLDLAARPQKPRKSETMSRLEELRLDYQLRPMRGPRFPVGWLRCPSCMADLPEAVRVPGGACPACGYAGAHNPNGVASG